MQYGPARRSSSARDYNYGPGVEHCPAPCLGYSFIAARRSGRSCSTACPVTFSLAIGAAVLWVLIGVATGVLSALRRGSVFDRAAMAVALGRRLAADLLHRPAVAGDLHLQARLDHPGRQLHPVRRRTRPHWSYDLILPWITLAFLFAATYARLTRANMLETLGEDYIRTARAKGLRERTVIGKHGLRSG